MANKSVREMGKHEKRRHSLSFKTLLTTQLLALLLGVILVAAGFLLYFLGIMWETCDRTSNMAAAEALMLDRNDADAKTKEILKVYDSIPEETRGDGSSSEYQDRFLPVMDEMFRELQEDLRITKEELGLRNSFIVAIDEETNRMIYLIDSDPDMKTFCWPGTWDTYKPHEISVLVYGKRVSALQRQLGLRDRPQATITYLPAYGLRCTGGTTLYKEGKYTVMLCLDEKLDHMITSSKIFLVEYNILMFIVIFLIGIISVALIRRSMVRPIKQMAGAARDYAEDKQSGESTSNHFKDLKIQSGDEIEELSLTMSDMETSLAEYVANLTEVTAEQEHIRTELNLASRIQATMLPSTFPAFPERDEFDIYALMHPAREVGGDFYDFFLIDDDHLAMMIADVSGKGIPAALFMMGSKIILDNRIMDTGSPAFALEQANDMIMTNNQEEMFVTVWIGILEISTGRIVASNAGHEKPLVIHPDGHAEMIRDKNGFVVGGLENMKYRDYELKLEPGSKLILYTDGVPEASTAANDQFGMVRLLEVVNGMKDVSAQEALESIENAVKEFVGEDEQFDDMTMLCLQYNGK